ncbi:phosphotransferase [Nocardia halotolerans]|uniref:Phosphotransferase n=1 Tax=Nocardia halotolerans TaxID=1755878 RepID=A0ABV8VLH8_9NOCA
MADDQVFGMGEQERARPTWPALTEDEVAHAVAATWGGAQPLVIEWRSPRPLSSTVGVRCSDGARLVVKRLPLRLRDEAALAEEHRFTAHLRAAGIPVPEARAVVGDRLSGTVARRSAPGNSGPDSTANEVAARRSAKRDSRRDSAEGEVVVRRSATGGSGHDSTEREVVVRRSATGGSGHDSTEREVVVRRSATGGSGRDSIEGEAASRQLTTGDAGRGRTGQEAAGGFVYEVQRAGVGEDRYREDFSWSPYRDTVDAAAAGAMLARLHLAATGFDAPPRPARPLVSTMHGGVISAVDWHIARRPALARFLADRDWRTEVPDLRADLTAATPLWTHGDWHPTNLLWQSHEVSSVIDFGLADRTTAMFDLATAVERSAVDWVSLRDGGPAHVRTDQITALIEAYRSVRPLAAGEQTLLTDLLPLVHIGYELSEIDYFLTVAHDPHNAEIAYRDWLIGHLHWYISPAGQDLLATVRAAAA